MGQIIALHELFKSITEVKNRNRVIIDREITGFLKRKYRFANSEVLGLIGK